MMTTESQNMIVEPIRENGLIQVSSEATTGSPEASSTASDSPTPTNSVHEKNWPSHWQGLVSEEQRQLLGTEEESSDRHSSDGEDEIPKEVWTINEEQQEYYRTQFCNLQPDPSCLLPGPTARQFFEKSKLPVQELRKIWQLADVTKDGALSLAEFNVAMHLVVLRRNNIPLPDVLPPALLPSVTGSRASSPALSTAGSTSSPHRGKEWTKFVDSPTSSVSSPGPKPVNFDFHKSAVEQDPKILHPVPLRVTPAPDLLESEEPKKLTEQLSGGEASPIRPIQRPQPKKPAAPGPGAIPPPPQPVLDDVTNSGPVSLPTTVLKKEPPPPPPPRPHRTHTRSSSLDLNRLGKSGILTNIPPVPPRTSPGSMSPKKYITHHHQEGEADQSTAFADFAQFPAETSDQVRSHGAFQVYRKPIPERSSPPFREIPPTPSDGSLDARKEHNEVLRQLCATLHNDLTLVKEEKISLQLQLDKLNAKIITS
ncbi:ralBP1-associated Eps domain-containing protein 1-like [Macrosteles quadrilineatus]|uniref:ralBP1-associated Eps domain-containing protein 1-like n=1 Tax=Macrosteles quadrilineatus TaxID=74068 RepID=UPI0023E1F69C|nr:ralBP1-associated Eps domain-containing protein 1-like [Macrosteles quadrilineatus]XP_054267453.1 ralBP1-associated Eps domain-containing protein 1-like [Macrosteles quadrilineatus]XP_054267454.1 ralBP1-associated Eps domain-containing protein 1-like [Macrosteles quadrilineatus]